MLNNKACIKAMLLYGYLHITEYVKIVCNLNIDEIRLVLKHSENIKKIVIKSQDACYDILSELNEFARSHKNICLSYKCTNFVMRCQENDRLKNMSENLTFYVQNFHISFIHCYYCFEKSFNLLRRIKTEFDKNKCDLEDYKKRFLFCSNAKEIFISTRHNPSLQKIHPKLLKYIFQLRKLEGIIFNNIIFTEILIKHILESENLIFLKLYNSSVPSELCHKYKHLNHTVRGIAIKKTILTFGIDFIKFISSFQNLIFFKIYIKNIDSEFRKIIVECTYKMYKPIKYKYVSKLEYLKMTINEDITMGFPILFALSHFFDISNLNVLALEINKLDEKDAHVISNLKCLKEILVSVYLPKTEIILKRLTKILENKTITRIRLDIRNLNVNIFEYLYNFKNIEFVLIRFKNIEAHDVTFLHKMKLTYPNNVTFFCKIDISVSFEAFNFCKEYNIGFFEN